MAAVREALAPLLYEEAFLMALNQRPTGTDDDLVPIFKHLAVPNEAKSRAEGRPVFDDLEVVEIRKPGARDYQPFPVTAVSHWINDPFTGGQRQVTYAERFSRQYRQFKEQAAQTKSGTPLDLAPFLTEAGRAMLRAMNIYTVEALAHVDGQELKNLGPGGREQKNQAIDYIAESKQLVPNIEMQAELEALRARTMALEADNEALKARNDESSQFDEMSGTQLKDYIERESGSRPLGNPSRKTLVRSASDLANRRNPLDAA
jgi:hypothetical protein